MSLGPVMTSVEFHLMLERMRWRMPESYPAGVYGRTVPDLDALRALLPQDLQWGPVSVEARKSSPYRSDWAEGVILFEQQERPAHGGPGRYLRVAYFCPQEKLIHVERVRYEGEDSIGKAGPLAGREGIDGYCVNRGCIYPLYNCEWAWS